MRGPGAVVLAALALGGCVQSGSVQCADGLVCPIGTTCGVPTGCIAKGDCGDGVISGAEVCDDGNVMGGDGCSADCSSPEVCGDGTVDPDAGEECDDANTASHDGCSSRCRLEELTWRSLGPGPPPRQYPAFEWDADRGRVVMFGGKNYPTMPYTAETWYERAGTWTRGPDAPTAVFGAAMATDGRGTLLAYGGENQSGSCTISATNCSTCFVLGDTSWTACPTKLTVGRFLHAMATAPDGSIVVYGGLTQSSIQASVHIWKQGAWSNASLAPDQRYQLAMTFDPRTSRTFVIGGAGVSSQTLAWDGTRWRPQYSGIPRTGTTSVYEPRRQLIVAFGGIDVSDRPANVLEWDGGGGWTSREVPGGPAGRYAHAMVYDAVAQGIVVYGGSNGSAVLDDTWLLRLDDGGADDACDGATDLDEDGKLGCADEDCWAFCTPRCPPGLPCDPAAPHCGDGVCNAFLETATLCAADCPP